jgi:Domain of unknown function (DUF5666)
VVRGPGIAACACAVLVAAAVCTGLAAAATPVSGSVDGPVTAVKGSTFKLKTSLSPTGSSTVSVVSATVITEQAVAPHSALRKGACVMAVGKKNAKGVVTASRVTVSAAVKGSCTSGFTRRGGTGGGPPQGGGGQRPPGGFTGSANFGFAFGQVTKTKGSTLTVKGFRGTTTVTVPAKTQVLETKRVGPSAIEVKMCAFVRGTSTDKGVKVKAQNVSLSKPTKTGCTSGFRRP